jgi:hypothetical protein
MSIAFALQRAGLLTGVAALVTIAMPMNPAAAQTTVAPVVKETSMVTAIVRFPLAKGTTREAAKTLFETSAPTFRTTPGLIRKYYLFGDGPTGGGIYLWESREAAERLYTPEWRKSLAQRIGAEPEIQFFDSPVIVDNKAGEILVR